MIMNPLTHLFVEYFQCFCYFLIKFILFFQINQMLSVPIMFSGISLVCWLISTSFSHLMRMSNSLIYFNYHWGNTSAGAAATACTRPPPAKLMIGIHRRFSDQFDIFIGRLFAVYRTLSKLNCYKAPQF